MALNQTVSTLASACAGFVLCPKKWQIAQLRLKRVPDLFIGFLNKDECIGTELLAL